MTTISVIRVMLYRRTMDVPPNAPRWVAVVARRTHRYAVASIALAEGVGDDTAAAVRRARAALAYRRAAARLDADNRRAGRLLGVV